MYIVFLICTLSIIVGIPTIIPSVALGQSNQTSPTKEELEIIKAQTEIKLLESQIEKETSISPIFFTHVLPIVGAAGIAFIPAFFAWRHERNKIPTVEQEKIINEIATKWYYHRHLYVYNAIWKKIELSEDQESEINKAWEYLCVKEFPTSNYDGMEGFNAKQVKADIANYLAQRLHLSKKELLRKKHRKDKNEDIANYLAERLHLSNTELLRKKDRKDKNEEDGIEHRLDIITDASSVSYYDMVRKVLPEVAQKAVSATLGEEKYTKEDHEKVFEESLKKLKRMMIFYRLREDKKVAEAILYGAVYDSLKARSTGDKQL
jgi:hypothetical protein